VLVKEVVNCLVHVQEGTYVDGTAGEGGHSEAILERLAGRGRLVCLDRDPDAVNLCRRRLNTFHNVCVIRANFADLDEVIKDLNLKQVEGVLLDLGMSSHQLEKSGRGFSFSKGEPLDMRMNPENKLTAGHLVNELPARDLEEIFRAYGEEKRARSIARAIVHAREKEFIGTASRLADVIDAVYPKPRRNRFRNPATRTFQALRIAVNRELKNLDMFLDKIPSLLTTGGRLVVLSYHSLEDRRVKQAMVGWEQACTCPPDFPQCLCKKAPIFSRLFKKGLKPDQKEIEHNPRARNTIHGRAARS